MPEKEFEKKLKEVEGELQKIDGWLEKLDPKMSGAEFKKIIEESEELGEKIGRLGYLPELMEAANQKDRRAKWWKTKVSDVILRYNPKLIKLSHWLKGLGIEGKKILDDKNAKRLFGTIPDLTYGLWHGRKAAKYSLREREEDIIDNKDTNGTEKLTELRDLIETDFEYKMDKKVIRVQAELLKYVYDKNPQKRERAYRSLLTKHREHLDKFFAIYQGVARDWMYEAKLRGYESPITVRNFDNHVPDKVVEVLLDVCKKNRGIFQEYFKWKAKRLGMKRLRRFDVYAPLDIRSQMSDVSFGEAKRTVLESFGEFSPRFRKYAEKIFEEQHIDSHPRKNKRNGAFCATVSPKIPPYVLLNHTGTERDVAVMAHELGHAVHSLYADRHYPSSQHANLPLSETASTLGEMVVFEEILEGEKDPKIKQSLLSDKIADSYASILRQNYFVIFEIEAFKLIEKATTAEKLSNLYLKLMREQFGESVEIDPIFRYEWAYVSHFFESPFYCYAYNFGELLSYALYAKYKEEGQKFVPRIEKVLEAGGSKKPDEILREVGVDMESEDFWQESFKIIEEWIERLKQLD